ncbi:epidermal growth factor-activated receptor [Desmophyllum pertusum]|uniref:Epidermal growth factor-activated receptor n=1 Tax=Desmophyllum pertusum TaxID=174260 RepID=A0A9W9Z568_9CNID|nr:epidermal growth factor-activated receptor [Desmophyllum pertusum]
MSQQCHVHEYLQQLCVSLTVKRVPTGDGRICRDVDECAAGTSCIVATGAECINSKEALLRQGRVGFQKTGDNCTDIDECQSPESNNCDVNALCTNAEGSYILGRLQKRIRMEMERHCKERWTNVQDRRSRVWDWKPDCINLNGRLCMSMPGDAISDD